MKNLTSCHKKCLYIITFLCIICTSGIYAQVTPQDSVYLPPITINSLNGYGPYVIGTKRSNLFIVYDLPANTSEITIRFIDSKGVQIGESYTKTGSSLDYAEWSVESDTMDFPLSPQLSVEIHYQSDSIAFYNIPYTVYPDTVKFFATEGWGPFITNNYPLTDTSWNPVPELYNTFTAKNLPPRSDSLVFQLLTADSTVIDSLFVYTPPGEYLDSAVYPHVRMDSLPLSIRFLRTLIWCEGGPDEGLGFHKEKTIIPQKPKLISKSEGVTLYDSIGVFVQNQLTGQALLVDSMKYGMINNGPGEYSWATYRGPYSLDLMKGGYTIEAWLRFDPEKMANYPHPGAMSFMSVDSVWRLAIVIISDNVFTLTINSLAGGEELSIFSTDINIDEIEGSEWHHIAFTSYWEWGDEYPAGNFYLDGRSREYVYFDESDYNYIINYINYEANWKTIPLHLGAGKFPDVTQYSYITAMDEVRVWNRTLTAEEIWNNYQKTILQDPSLVGYWNFNDLRNRLNFISDLSYHNNTGLLKKGATFIPQYPYLQKTLDTIEVTSSNALTDSIIYSFIDINNKIVDSDTLKTYNGGDTLLYDVSALPYNISRLRISDYFPGVADSGFVTNYKLQGWAPKPIATPQYNWNTYYSSPTNTGKLWAPIIVSGLPLKTQKVTMGLTDGNNLFDTVSFTKNSIPYQYSLTLNGTDNYVITSQNINSPENFTLMLWVKTTTKTGGKLIGFSDTQNGINSNKHDREIVMQPDGTIRFKISIAGTLHTLYAVNPNNDGGWHHVAAVVENSSQARLYIDGCLVDSSTQANIDTYQGYWVIGRHNEAKLPGEEVPSEYFEGTLSEISIWSLAMNYDEVNTYRFLSENNANQVLHYKLDEGIGNEIHDTQGNNEGELMGSSKKWQLSNGLSFVAWNHDMAQKDAGTYTFFARVFYLEGPDEGAYYPLGNFNMTGFVPGYQFGMNLTEGQGYFNEGTALKNTLAFTTDYTHYFNPDWKNDFVKYVFLSPQHYIISSNIHIYTEVPTSDQFVIDMGDAPPGSYLSIQFGWTETNNTESIERSLAIPLFIKPMIPPKVSGNFGPFDQAIAPGCMEQDNTFIISTEVYSDLNKVLGKFYDDSGKEIAVTEAVQLNDTTWHISYYMGKLSPPVTNLKIEYYLGQNPHPALIEGPFAITIHKTRPKWFDFIPDDDFHDVQQNGDEVTFSIDTPFEKSFLINNSETMEIPNWVPLLGGSSASMESPTAEAYLKYIIPEYKIEMNEPPEFFQKVFNLGAGTAETLRLGFNYSQHNTYGIDSHNNLLATQNFSMGGSATSGFKKLKNIAKKVKEIIEAAKVSDPETVIVSPSFSLTFSGSFEYSSREHLMVDTNTGKWGSYGNLKVDANPDHEEAFKNSASFKFYSGSLGTEFSIGMELLEGLVAGYFGVDGRFLLGFGHSYTTIPNSSTRRLKSFTFQTYGRFYVSVLWGWYEKTIWGPKLFYSKTLWGDDMKACFPPMKKEYSPLLIKAHSSWPELVDAIKPVSTLSKMPMPYPQPIVISSGGLKLFSWVERGNKYGERSLMAKYMTDQNPKFSGERKIEFNNNALNGPVADVMNKNTAFFSWAQTRQDPKSIMQVYPADVLKEFVKSQDIWFAVYDLERDSLLQKNMLHDDTSSRTAGRAESNPVVAALSESKAIIIWQVADIDAHRSEIWHSILQKQGDQWTASLPEIMTETEGVASQLKIASPEENIAVAVWMNTSRENTIYNKIMTAIYDGDEWSEPTVLDDQPHHYYNYFDMCFREGLGGLVMASFIEDSAYNHHETLTLHTWDTITNLWDSDSPFILMADSVNHMQFPRMAISDDGITTIAIKVEEFVNKDKLERISQVDLLIGDLKNPNADWTHVKASEFVCDTTKQVADLQLSYESSDTLMILSNEFPMLATNANFEPVNGIFFGDPYMKLVLRCFSVNESGEVQDLDEGNYFLGIQDPVEYHSDVRLYQNYPNPCNDFTTIKFDIPDGAHVLLELFDMSGLRTAVLADQKLMAGQYEVRLNTAVLKPGTYIYKLTTDDSMSALRMIVNH